MTDETLGRVQILVERGDYLVSEHGREELVADALAIEEVLSGIFGAEIIEAYPTAWKGPSVLVLQSDRFGRPVHVLWGVPREKLGPAVLVTAYRPDPDRWSDDFRRRRE